MESQRSPFLRLPREIRDEIYKFLLIFDPPARIRSADLELPDPPKFEVVSVPNTILRVNKQIHSEAAEIFYGFNTFSVRISTLSLPRWGVSRRLDPCTIEYTAPWETMAFNCRRAHSLEEIDDPYEPLAGYEPDNQLNLEPGERSITWEYEYVESLDSSFYADKHIRTARIISRGEEKNILKMPAFRYHHLIRRINLDFIECAIPSILTGGHIQSAEYLRMMLFPALNRLENSLEDKGKGVEVNIVISAKRFRKDWENDVVSSWPVFTTDARLRLIAVQRIKGYIALCRFLWPLSTMQWKSNRISTVFDEQYPGLMEQEFERCRLLDGPTDDAVGRQPKEIPTEVVGGSVGSMWAFVRGRLGVIGIGRCVTLGIIICPVSWPRGRMKTTIYTPNN
ncbi:hypothetical protein TWF730_011307 [Orbilia blumenaviensis]|uniref:Uncharacterized protein n=1 Tax=Orbilia blumenaviensis TaxID=1796055 RepID=A0AAV9UK30_9PEZI